MPLHEEGVSRLVRIRWRRLEPWPDVHLAVRSDVVLRPDHKLEPDIQVCRAERIPASRSSVHDDLLMPFRHLPRE
jgi:hypothetical protein